MASESKTDKDDNTLPEMLDKMDELMQRFSRMVEDVNLHHNDELKDPEDPTTQRFYKHIARLNMSELRHMPHRSVETAAQIYRSGIEEAMSAAAAAANQPERQPMTQKGYMFLDARDVAATIPPVSLPQPLFFINPLQPDDRIVLQLHWSDILCGATGTRLLDESDGQQKRACLFCQFSKVPSTNLIFTIGNTTHVKSGRMFSSVAAAETALRRALVPSHGLFGRIWYFPYRSTDGIIKFVPLDAYIRTVGFEKNGYTVAERNEGFAPAALLFAGRTKREQVQVLRRLIEAKRSHPVKIKT